jgi:hypothetical protein
MGEILSGPSASDGGDEEMRLVRNARKIALLAMGLAYQKYLLELEKQQEILMNLADIIMEIFAMESSLLRSRKLSAAGKTGIAADMTSVFLRDALSRIEISARAVLAACSDGDTLRTNMAVLRRFAKYDPVDAIALRRRIAGWLLDAERYIV